MSYFLTLVGSKASPRLTLDLLAPVFSLLPEARFKAWLAPGRAGDIALGAAPLPSPVRVSLREVLDPLAVDMFVTVAKDRRKKALVADMESTMVAFEALDEMARVRGFQEEIKAITARAMNGEIGFRAALAERVRLLEGTPVGVLAGVLDTMKGTLNPGARALVATMKANGAICILATGGFTYFASWVAGALGFDAFHANVLDIADGRVSGRLCEPVLGSEAKHEILLSTCRDNGFAPGQVLAIGDGANDIPMLITAEGAGGMGIGYRPKPVVEQAVSNSIIYGDFCAALYAQGYNEEEIHAL